jgi:hypothetical protein
MNISLRAALLLTVGIASASVGRAAPGDFDVKTDPKCLAKDKSSTGIEKITTEKWVYNVTIDNKSARDHADLDVRYVIYAADVEPGSKAPPKIIRKRGSTKVAAIKSHSTSTFTTEPIDLVKTQLSQGVTYGSGARPRANDTLEGIRLRIYKGDEMLAEVARPPSLATKEPWEKANDPKAGAKK